MTLTTPNNSVERGTRILVVDDDKDLVFIVQALLMDAGYEVQSALDGLQGLETARAFRPGWT